MQCIEGAVVFVMTCNDANQNAGDSEECMIVAVHAAGCKKLEWHKMATVGKCFAKKEEEVTCNMQAELFEAIWCVHRDPSLQYRQHLQQQENAICVYANNTPEVVL